MTLKRKKDVGALDVSVNSKESVQLLEALANLKHESIRKGRIYVKRFGYTEYNRADLKFCERVELVEIENIGEGAAVHVLHHDLSGKKVSVA